jgi:di/tricarboxylate transporter
MAVLTEWLLGRPQGVASVQLRLGAAILGGTHTLIGTSTNLVVHALMASARKADPSMPLMGMFTLAPVGVACSVAGLGFIVASSRWLLPARTSFLTEVADPRQYTLEMQVEPGSAIDGLTIERARLRRLPGPYLSGTRCLPFLMARPRHM